MNCKACGRGKFYCICGGIGPVLTVLIALSVVACSGAPFTASDPPPGDDAGPPDVVLGSHDDGGKDEGGKDTAPPDAADGGTHEDADPPDSSDGGAPDASDGGTPDAAPDAPPDADSGDGSVALCCIGTMGNVNNVHCGVGSQSTCDYGDPNVQTFNEARCNGNVGDPCVAWTQEWQAPQDCLNPTYCCMGTIQPCQ